MISLRPLAQSFLPSVLAVCAAALLPVALPAQTPAQGPENKAASAQVDYTKFLAACAPGTKVLNVMIPMRDGVKLATDIFIPPGPGPFPVILSRGYYGRKWVYVGQTPPELVAGQIAYIYQDARGVFASEGKPLTLPDIASPGFEMNDSDDCLNWIAAQPWSNGRIGMFGVSGGGFVPCAAYLTRNPHLVMAAASISEPWPYSYLGFHNGARRGSYVWFHFVHFDVSPFPSPTIPTLDLARWNAIVANAVQDNPTILTNATGWYDLGSEAVLDEFAAFAASGKVFASVNPYAHGPSPYQWPAAKSPPGTEPTPRLADVLLGKGKIPARSQLTYYVMGNFRDPSTPGNFQKVTNVWPVPNTPQPWYFHGNGGLSTAAPTGDDPPQTYAYDPRNPAPSLGGNFTGKGAGPQDERPLLTRPDVIHFVSDPLTEPVEITGKIRATLFISTDVPDTEFVVKFTDVQPDGYEMLIRESATLGRSAKEFNGTPAALQKGQVYQLDLDLWSTAILLAKGHRLGVIVTSSSNETFQVHPNSFDPVTSFAASPIAHQQIYFSKKYPSCLTLPMVPVDAPTGSAASRKTASEK